MSRGLLVFFGVLLGLAVVVAGLSLRGEPDFRKRFPVALGADRLVAPAELAAWLVEGRRDFAVVDLRDDAAYARGHVRDAVHCGTCHRSREEGRQAMKGAAGVDLSRKLVLYTATGDEPIELPRLLRDHPRLYRLQGGFAAWERDLLAPAPAVPAGGEAALVEARRREAVRAFLTGERPATVAPVPAAPAPKGSGPHRLATTSEGC
jgi:rhodanese-related sulfurtransferase